MRRQQAPERRGSPPVTRVSPVPSSPPAAPSWPPRRPSHSRRSPMTDHHADRPQEVRAFFASRAATWDAKFPDDGPAYAAGVAELGLQEGERVLDAGCGTGRALPALRAAVGRRGTVLGADLTPEMLEAAVRAGRDRDAALLLADVSRLPLPDAALDAVFAAGLLSHLPDSAGGLTELARTVRPGGGWPSSTPSGGPPSPRARAARSRPTTCGPSRICGPSSRAAAGTSSGTRTRTPAIWRWRSAGADARGGRHRCLRPGPRRAEPGRCRCGGRWGTCRARPPGSRSDSP